MCEFLEGILPMEEWQNAEEIPSVIESRRPVRKGSLDKDRATFDKTVKKQPKAIKASAAKDTTESSLKSFIIDGRCPAAVLKVEKVTASKAKVESDDQLKIQHRAARSLTRTVAPAAIMEQIIKLM